MKQFVIVWMMACAVIVGFGTDIDDVFYGNVVAADGKTRINLLGPTRNQNQPKACDASWAFATTSTLSALFNVQKKGAFPEVVLSPQMLINCAPDTIKFSCTYGATPVAIEEVFKHLQNFGVSDESCNNYFASDEKNCTALNQCKDCHNGEDIHKAPVCSPVDHRVYKLSKYTAITSSKTTPERRSLTSLNKSRLPYQQKGHFSAKSTTLRSSSASGPLTPKPLWTTTPPTLPMPPGSV